MSIAFRNISIKQDVPMQTLSGVRTIVLGMASAAVGLALTGCAMQVAPNYDKLIASGIASANVETMQLLAAITDNPTGAPVETYSSRQAQYLKVIGTWNALLLESQVRPKPSTKEAQAIEKTMTNGQSAENRALQDLADSITKMKTMDQSHGLTSAEVTNFTAQITNYIKDASAYEAALAP